VTSREHELCRNEYTCAECDRRLICKPLTGTQILLLPKTRRVLEVHLGSDQHTWCEDDDRTLEKPLRGWIVDVEVLGASIGPIDNWTLRSLAGWLHCSSFRGCGTACENRYREAKPSMVEQVVSMFRHMVETVTLRGSGEKHDAFESAVDREYDVSGTIA
jgi:hypothetical protein